MLYFGLLRSSSDLHSEGFVQSASEHPTAQCSTSRPAASTADAAQAAHAAACLFVCLFVFVSFGLHERRCKSALSSLPQGETHRDANTN